MIFTHAPATLAAYSLMGRRIGIPDLIALGFFSMAPDFDHFLPASLHATRAYLHNLPSFLAVLAVVFLLQRRFLLHAAVGYGSHLLIDLADKGGIALLFRMSRQDFAMGLWHSPEPTFKTARGLALDATLSAVSVAVLLVVALVRRRRSPTPL